MDVIELLCNLFGLEKKKTGLTEEQLLKIEEKKQEKDELGDSIINFSKRANGYKFSDLSQIYSLIARFRTYELSKERDGRGVEE